MYSSRTRRSRDSNSNPKANVPMDSVLMGTGVEPGDV